MNKNKLIGIIAIFIFIIGWIVYAKIGLIFSLLIEIIALIVSIISRKFEKNVFSNIAIIGSTLLIVIMVVILISLGFLGNIGSDHLIQKANECKSQYKIDKKIQS